MVQIGTGRLVGNFRICVKLWSRDEFTVNDNVLYSSRDEHAVTKISKAVTKSRDTTIHDEATISLHGKWFWTNMKDSPGSLHDCCFEKFLDNVNADL